MDLIATCARHFERDACDELVGLLGACGDDGATASPSDMPGILTALTSMEPDAAIGALRLRLADEPWEFRYVMRVIPVHATCAAQAADIAGIAAGLASRILEGQTYRITLEKRNSGEPRDAIIGAVADVIDRRVCLDNPDWIVLVEILGPDAGVSIVRPDGILRVRNEKMASAEDGGALDEDVL